MAKSTAITAAKRPAPKRPQAKVRKKRTGAVSPEDLNLPRPSREDYAASVEVQIADFEETLDGIETDMESSGWDDIGEFRNRLDDLRERLKEARAQSEALEAAENASWPSLHEEMEETLLEMSDSIRDFSIALGRVLPE